MTIDGGRYRSESICAPSISRVRDGNGFMIECACDMVCLAQMEQFSSSLYLSRFLQSRSFCLLVGSTRDILVHSSIVAPMVWILLFTYKNRERYSKFRKDGWQKYRQHQSSRDQQLKVPYSFDLPKGTSLPPWRSSSQVAQERHQFVSPISYRMQRFPSYWLLTEGEVAESRGIPAIEFDWLDSSIHENPFKYQFPKNEKKTKQASMATTVLKGKWRIGSKPMAS